MNGARQSRALAGGVLMIVLWGVLWGVFWGGPAFADFPDLRTITRNSAADYQNLRRGCQAVTYDPNVGATGAWKCATGLSGGLRFVATLASGRQTTVTNADLVAQGVTTPITTSSRISCGCSQGSVGSVPACTPSASRLLLGAVSTATGVATISHGYAMGDGLQQVACTIQ